MADWFDTYRKLGQAVLRNAVTEAKKGTKKERESARAWLRDGDNLGFWCQVAGYDAQAVRDAAKRQWKGCDAT